MANNLQLNLRKPEPTEYQIKVLLIEVTIFRNGSHQRPSLDEIEESLKTSGDILKCTKLQFESIVNDIAYYNQTETEKGLEKLEKYRITKDEAMLYEGSLACQDFYTLYFFTIRE